MACYQRGAGRVEQRPQHTIVRLADPSVVVPVLRSRSGRRAPWRHPPPPQWHRCQPMPRERGKLIKSHAILHALFDAITDKTPFLDGSNSGHKNQSLGPPCAPHFGPMPPLVTPKPSPSRHAVTLSGDGPAPGAAVVAVDHPPCCPLPPLDRLCWARDTEHGLSLPLLTPVTPD